MTDQEKELEQALPEFTLEDIMKEFAPEVGEEAPAEQQTPETEETEVFEETEETDEADEADEAEEAEEPEELEQTVRLDLPEKKPAQDLTGDTVRLDLPPRKQAEDLTGDTQRLPELPGQEPAREEDPQPQRPLPKKAEPFSQEWEPEYEQPIADYVPQQPILFRPRSRLRELKRKLVAGPERRYYEINEQGFGKLQLAIFLSFVVVVLSAGVSALYAVGSIPESRIKLMVFVQFIAMLICAALGSYQLLEGLADLGRKRFTLNTMLVLTLAACLADGIFCLGEKRVPCCAAFGLQVMMSLWGAYQRRTTEMAQMDTLRKAVRLDSLTPVADYYEGLEGLVRGEGQVEDFMDNYSQETGPEKVLSWYALVAAVMSITIGVSAGVLHQSLSFGVQVLSVTLLAAVPVTSFITLSRPMAVLEKRLHKVGAVICGWQGVQAMNRRVLFPLRHTDLFPTGTCKMNGVKYYGDRDPDQVMAYSAALIAAHGSGLTPLFQQLLASRSGRNYTARNLQVYGVGGIGGEVCGEPVLMGSLALLREMGVEVPEGISVNQAVYAAIDGELCGVFAVTYAKEKDPAAGFSALCGYRGLHPMILSGDFMLTESFLKSKFSVRTRRVTFPDRSLLQELQEREAPEGSTAAALVTSGGLVPFAYAVTGARSLRAASVAGLVIHILGGILGMLMMLLLAVMGQAEVLTPVNLFLYELVWMIPGLLVTEWTRTV